MRIRFDTRDKKPKLYHLAALTAVTAVVLFFLFQSSGRLKWTSLVLSAHFLLTVIFLADTFRKQLEYNPYSYNTILYSGFALFFLYAAVSWIYITVRCFRDEASFTNQQMFLLLLYSAKNYMMLTAPFLFIFSAALFISNIALIRHEGPGFLHILGMILACLLVGGQLLLYLGSGWLRRAAGPMLSDMVLSLFSAFYLYFECMLTGTVIADVIAAKYRPDMDKDFLIVLGCGLMPDGTPIPILKGRLDLAKDFHDEQLRQTGKPSCFVVSGCQGPDEIRSEAAAMKEYLMEQGIPEASIFPEDRSGNTEENMRFSKQIIDRIRPEARTAFFTTNYHVFRAGLKARRVKLRAVGMGAPTKWYFWPNAAVREFAGLLTGHKVKQGLVIIGLGLFYVLLTFLAYR